LIKTPEGRNRAVGALKYILKKKGLEGMGRIHWRSARAGVWLL